MFSSFFASPIQSGTAQYQWRRRVDDAAFIRGDAGADRAGPSLTSRRYFNQ